MKLEVLTFLGGVGVVLAGCGGDVSPSGQGGAVGASVSASSAASVGVGGNGSSSASAGEGVGGGSTGAGGMTGAGGAGTGGMAGAGGGGCGFCDFTCCGAVCVNAMNDINNCGACGAKCQGPNPYCDNGKCGTPPCNGAACGPAGLCCGLNCCKQGELCCDVPGPVGPMLGCFVPDMGTCPKGCTSCQCAAPDTLIATPTGERPIASLAEGDLVYSVDNSAIVAVPIKRAQRVPVKDHRVMRVELSGGRVLLVSGGHPTADGRSFSDLSAGGWLDGARVVDARSVAYEYDATYDILPSSDTGFYFAAGALIGSTMAPPEALSPRAAP